MFAEATCSRGIFESLCESHKDFMTACFVNVYIAEDRRRQLPRGIRMGSFSHLIGLSCFIDDFIHRPSSLPRFTGCGIIQPLQVKSKSLRMDCSAEETSKYVYWVGLTVMTAFCWDKSLSNTDCRQLFVGFLSQCRRHRFIRTLL